jgi:hypothetical protein
MSDIPAFDPGAKCSPMLTLCPRCKNVTKDCDGFLGFPRVAVVETPRPLCELTHIEALVALQVAEAEVVRLRQLVQNRRLRRRRSLLRALDAPQLTLPPLYHAVMADIKRLMDMPESTLTPADEALLDTLVDVAMVYEQCCLPGWLFPEVPGIIPSTEGETP